MQRAVDEQDEAAIRYTTEERTPRSGSAAVAPTATERGMTRLAFRHLMDELEVTPSREVAAYRRDR
jgi:hypothetical protein